MAMRRWLLTQRATPIAFSVRRLCRGAPTDLCGTFCVSSAAVCTLCRVSAVSANLLAMPALGSADSSDGALTLKPAPLVPLAVPAEASPPSPSVSDPLVGHCRLLGHIASSREPLANKRRRAAGVVRKLDDNLTDWLTDPLSYPPTQRTRRRWLLLESLARCAPFLKRHDHRSSVGGISTKEDEMSWTGASAFFSLEMHDALCLCLQTCVQASTEQADVTPLALLEVAVQLELADGESLQSLTRELTSKAWCRAATPHELAQAMKWISLAVKRCKCQVPPLDALLCLLATADLSSRDALEVLSALVRLRDVRAVEVSKVVERRAVAHVSHYSAKDVVYALQAVAILDTCDTTFAAATLKRCEVLIPTMSASQVGDVCKYVALLNGDRQRNDVAMTCPRELRRVLPALISRTESLLGQFSLRDARCVLRCFQQHNVRHSVVFSQLTPLAL